MSGSSWSFRTAGGTVTVRDGEIAVASRPRDLLGGQYAKLRDGSGWQRLRVAARIVGGPLTVAAIAYRLADAARTGLEPIAFVYAASTLFLVWSLWSRYGRETTIDRSSIEAVVLDEDERELRIHHRSGADSLLSVGSDADGTELELPTDDDLREARQVLRLRGVSVESPEDRETETVYRFTSANGACFCGRCDSQVSPSDGECPACGYRLRVEVSDRDGSPTNPADANGDATDPGSDADGTGVGTPAFERASDATGRSRPGR